MADLGSIASYRVPSYRKQLDIWTATNAVAQARSVRIGNYVRWVPVWRSGLTGTIPLVRYRADGSFSGTVTENGTPIPYAVVAVYYRPTMQLITTARCNASGAFSVPRLDPADSQAYFIVAFDPDGGVLYNALIYDRLTPVGDGSVTASTISPSGFLDDAFGTANLARLADEILADSPSALWILKEASGTTVVDSSGNAVNGTYVAGNVTLNQPALVDGVPCILAGTTTTSLVASIASNAAFTFGSGDFTFGCVFKRASATVVRTLMAKERIGADYAEFAIQLTSAGKILLAMASANSAGAVVIGTSSASFDDNLTHLVIVERSGATTKVFVDNVEVISVSFAGSIYSSANALGLASSVIANSGFSSQPLGGYLSHAFTIKSAIGATRRAAYYAACGL